MKRIIATIIAGGLGALTLAAAPAHADERRPYDGRDRGYEDRNRPAPPPRRVTGHERHARDGRDEDGDRDDGYRRRDGYSRPDEQRGEPYRHASVGMGTGDLDVRIDVGGWLAHR